MASGAFSVACAPLKVARGEAVAALDVLCDASITEYLDGISFTALHLITSRHALRLLLLTLTDAAAALRAFWPAWADRDRGIRRQKQKRAKQIKKQAKHRPQPASVGLSSAAKPVPQKAA